MKKEETKKGGRGIIEINIPDDSKIVTDINKLKEKLSALEISSGIIKIEVSDDSKLVTNIEKLKKWLKL